MKQYKLILTGFFILLSAGLNAQLFVGGDASLITTSGKHENTQNSYTTSNYDIGISPIAGKFLSDKVALGAGVNLGLTGYKNDMVADNRRIDYSIGVNPFIRYYAVRWNKLSLFGQGNIGVTFSGSKIKTGGTTTNGPSESMFTLSCYPGLSYDIGERLSLESTIGIFNLSYNYTLSKDNGNTVKASTFGFGAGIDRIVTLGSVSIGAIYRF